MMNPMAGFGHAESLVLKMMVNRLDKGHMLFTDYFYTSVPLEDCCRRRPTCGTVRRNRKHLPEAVISSKPKGGHDMKQLLVDSSNALQRMLQRNFLKTDKQKGSCVQCERALRHSH